MPSSYAGGAESKIRLAARSVLRTAMRVMCIIAPVRREYVDRRVRIGCMVRIVRAAVVLVREAIILIHIGDPPK